MIRSYSRGRRLLQSLLSVSGMLQVASRQDRREAQVGSCFRYTYWERERPTGDGIDEGQ